MAVTRVGFLIAPLLALTTTFGVPLPALAAPSPPASASRSAAPPQTADYSDDAVQSTNARRAGHDRVRLGGDPCLQRMAAAQAERQADRGELFHQDLNRVQDTCDMGYVGENVAFGYPDGHAVVRGWMASSGHRANILRSEYRLVGIAAVRRDGSWWVSQVFGRTA